jgi:hypothetical protein
VPPAKHRRRGQNVAEAEAGGGSASAATAKGDATIRANQALALPKSAAYNRLARRAARRSSSCSASTTKPVARVHNLGQAAILPRPHVAFRAVLLVPLGAILALRASLRSWSCKPNLCASTSARMTGWRAALIICSASVRASRRLLTGVQGSRHERLHQHPHFPLARIGHATGDREPAVVGAGLVRAGFAFEPL